MVAATRLTDAPPAGSVVAMSGLRSITLLLCALLIDSAGSASPPAPPLSQSGVPRDFALVDGARLNLDQLRGKVVILNIWATWCVPCRAELPLLNAFYRRHRADGLVIIGIAVDAGTAKGDQLVSPAIRYLQARHVYGRDLTVASVPTNYVFARNGRLAYVERQAFDARSIERLVGPLLKAR